MKHAVIFDCEFLTSEGSPSRFWCGPYDPDPIVVQIGLVKISLETDFSFLDTLRIHIIPHDRTGKRIALDPFFTELTGITDDNIDKNGLALSAGLQHVRDFASGARFWSWGKDEINMMAISCYVGGITPPISAAQFGNACKLLLRAGMPYEDIKKTRSNRLADYHKIDHPPLKAHDALNDALSVAYVVQSLLREKKLMPVDLE